MGASSRIAASRTGSGWWRRRAAVRASRVSRVGGDDGDELLVERVARDRRLTAEILEAWLRGRARAALDEALARHGAGAGRRAPQRDDPRHDVALGQLLAAWCAVVQLAADPRPARGARRRRRPRGCATCASSATRPAFWALLETRVPDHASWRRWLRRHAPELHAALD